MFIASYNLSVDGIASNFKHNFSRQIDLINNSGVVKARREKRKNLISDGTKQQYSNHSANGNSNPETSCKWNRSQRMKENASGANFVGQSYRNLQKLSKEKRKKELRLRHRHETCYDFFLLSIVWSRKLFDWIDIQKLPGKQFGQRLSELACNQLRKHFLSADWIWFRVVVLPLLVNSLNAENVCSAITQFSDGYL